MTNGDEANADVTTDRLLSGVPDRLRPFVRIVVTGGTPAVPVPIASAFWLAMHAIEPALTEPRVIHTYFGWDPDSYVVSTAIGGVAAYAPPETAINFYHGAQVFLSIPRMTERAPTVPFMAAGILEELVHVWMNIHDENLVALVVDHLYGGIQLVNCQYWDPNYARST